VYRLRPCSFFLTFLFLAAACSSTDTGTIQILITDPDTFSASPAVTTLTVYALDTTGDPPTKLASAPVSAATIDLGPQSESSIDAIQVTGTDANGIERVSGTSLPVQFAELVGSTLPVFVQRVGDVVPVPGGPLSDSRQSPVLAVFQGEYLFIGGGSDASIATTSQIYDFWQFAPLVAPPALPRVPLSVAFVGTVAWLFNASGSATYFDFSDNAASDVTPLTGGSFTFADVAGGATVIADDGTEFIVGGTRTTSASSAVLEINPNDTSNASYPFGNASWLSLTMPRLGAAATWVKGFGLVVAGGSASASGVEVFALPSTSGAAASVPALGKALPYPPDVSVGAGATTLTTSTVLLAGGITPSFQDAGARTIDLGCTSACTPAVWEPALPEPITSAVAFTLTPASAFVVGNEPFSGVTHAFLLTTASATEIPTQVPHKNATATLSPVGSVVIVGGASEIESFVPSPASP